jgi:hypothetical protein
MAQTLYGLIALALVSMLALNMQRGTTNTQQRQIFNEVATQITGVASEVFDHIARDAVYFDKYVYDTRTVFPTCGRTTTPSVFTAEASFVPAADYASSLYIEGFHGMTGVPIDRDDLSYLVDITVRYVDPVTLAPSAVQTFAKEVTLTISSPLLFLSTPANPVEVTMRRVFEYDMVTKAAYIPYSSSGTCPSL